MDGSGPVPADVDLVGRVRRFIPPNRKAGDTRGKGKKLHAGPDRRKMGSRLFIF